jgi:hypothetical protein
MPIETNCPGCSKKLRVGDEHAGKKARCPLCSTIYIVGGAAQAATPTPPAGDPFPSMPATPGTSSAAQPSTPAGWYMQAENGQVYGPVSRAELDNWFRDGRVTVSCKFRSGEGAWQSAASVFPALNVGNSSTSSSNPFSSPAASVSSTSSSYSVPHRGAIILTLALLGWFFPCPIFCVAAWLMGSADLREIDSGRMDPSGRGLTQAGQIIGIVLSVLWGLGAFGMFCILGLGAGFG